jgi:hypothetical protein
MNWLKTLGTTIGVTLKRVYDILATYLLFWVLYVTAVALGLHFGLPYVWEALGVANPELVWAEMAAWTGLSVPKTTFLVYGLLHLLVFVIVRRPIAVVQPWFEKAFDRVAGSFDRVTSDRFSLRLFGESVFTIIVSALLIPFVWQPTLVRGMSVDAWLDRASNLADGSAVLDLPDSTLAYYRSFTAEPVVVDNGVTADEVDRAIAQSEVDDADIEVGQPETELPVETDEDAIAGVPRAYDGIRVEISPRPGSQPIMDRWNDHIWEAVEGDPDMFAYVKAFMYVESAGRQYAVSHTGCAGLMQFCSGTAKSPPFRQVFGRGEVYACGCRGDECRIPRNVQRALESGQYEKVAEQADALPCEISDARFDPEKAIKAGYVYVDRLHDRYGGNIYLMYIGYNSGPGVADKVWDKVSHNPDASLDEIEMHLEDALRPYQGSGAASRASGLVKTHLPKIKRAQARYATQIDIADGGAPSAPMTMLTSYSYVQ